MEKVNHKNKLQIEDKVKFQNGITLLALVITIIVLLILAGITIGAITGDNGIIKNVVRAKEETEIANEKEIIEKATVQAMENNKYGNIEESELQEQLNKETGEGKTEATDIGKEFEVIFKESNRYYTVDKDGNIEGAYQIIQDKFPGDITVGKNGETLDGDSEETAYQIWNIEDLVAFSKDVNSGKNYKDKYICLMQDLDFSSKVSYNDWKTKAFDIYLGGDGNIGIKEQLSNNGNGFKIIGTVTNQFFGNFNGNNKVIKNIVINDVGFFGYIQNATIKNLIIRGNVKSEANAGGIVYNAISSYIYNCYNQITVIRSKCWWNMSTGRK